MHLEMSKSYFAGMNKSALKSAIRAKLAEYSYGEVFEFPMLSDLVLAKHYFCSVQQLRPVAFRKVRGEGVQGVPYYFQGLFGDRWHGVSWVKCIDIPKEHDWLVRALRDAVHPIVFKHRKCNPTCEVCGVAASTEVDHVEPEFKVIADGAIATLTAEQITESIRSVDWWNEEAFRLPNDSPAIAYAIEAHRTAIVRAVCKQCHLISSAARALKKENGN